jgi:hypothetical protein
MVGFLIARGLDNGFYKSRIRKNVFGFDFCSLPTFTSLENELWKRTNEQILRERQD